MSAAKKVEDLVEGDLVDMQPEFEKFDSTDSADYLVSQSEYGHVAEIIDEGRSGSILVVFENLGDFGFPRGYEVQVQV